MTGTLRRRVAAAASAAVLAVTALVVAAPAGAADVCSGLSHPNLDSGSGRITHGTVDVHTGPAGSCRVVGVIGTSQVFSYYCYRGNQYGNTWTYGRYWIAASPPHSSGAWVYGWVWDDYLDDGGSKRSCN